MRNYLNSIGFHVKPSTVLRLALRRTLAVALAALAILSTIMPAPAFATDSDQQVKTVRVGWLVNNKGFQEGTPGERLSGWGYEYLQTLSYYTKGWQYEYVSGTFSELMDMLEAGEIDLMPNISYSAEREQKLLFSSNPEGTERYYIYARPDRDDLAKGDPQALQGLTIGCSPGVMQTIVGQQWLTNEGITCTYKEISTGGALFEALADGEMEGSLASLATTLHDKFGITVKTIALSNNKQMIKALSNGTIDVALPLFRDYWLAEQTGVIQSNSMGTVSLTAIHSGKNLNSDLKNIACTKSTIVNRFELESLIPNATVTEYSNDGEVLKALNEGKARCIIVPSTRLETLRDIYDIEDFETQELTNTAQLSCLISRGKPELLGIINKGIVNAGESLSANSYFPTSYSAQESDAFRLLYRNRIVIAAVVICILLTGIVILVWSLYRAQEERQKADAANATKTAFLTRMSHDIRTPLNGILGLIEIEELKDGDMQVARESRAKARVAANHLLSLINDILEMGKIEDRKLTPEHAPFNLKELCDDALVLCKLRASGNGITMQDNSLPYATGPYMIGSPTHIRRIIINLLDNSIKYNKRGGSVTFSSQTKPLDDGRALFCFSVSDTGIGMAPEFLKHIYEPFTQEGDDARSKFQGTGMGMPIVKSLIDMMGGTIEISSEVGVGSTFNVQIPLEIDKNPQAKERTDEQAYSCSLAGMNVLLAEDNELNAEIAQAQLESEGIVVTRAADGNEAVDLYVGRPAGSFDAILMDIMMPGMDGYEATRAIRLSEKADAADIPIIALTANAFAEDAKAAHDAGMNAHLSKPVDFNKLKNMLARIKKYGAVSL